MNHRITIWEMPNAGTDYDVLLWIEEAVAVDSFVTPEITMHSTKVTARHWMEASLVPFGHKDQRDSGLPA